MGRSYQNDSDIKPAVLRQRVDGSLVGFAYSAWRDVEWDRADNAIVIAGQSAEGSGATATGWRQCPVDCPHAELAGTRYTNGSSYALIANLPTSISCMAPDGFNLGDGAKYFVRLKWTDEKPKVAINNDLRREFA